MCVLALALLVPMFTIPLRHSEVTSDTATEPRSGAYRSAKIERTQQYYTVPFLGRTFFGSARITLSVETAAAGSRSTTVIADGGTTALDADACLAFFKTCGVDTARLQVIGEAGAIAEQIRWFSGQAPQHPSKRFYADFARVSPAVSHAQFGQPPTLQLLVALAIALLWYPGFRYINAANRS